jgi:hypothetical protein
MNRSSSEPELAATDMGHPKLLVQVEQLLVEVQRYNLQTDFGRLLTLS